MSTTLNSGNGNWIDLIRFSIKIFESLLVDEELKLREKDIELFYLDKCAVSLEGFEEESKLRILIGRIYYGLLQSLVDYFDLNRDEDRLSIHTDIKQAIRNSDIKQILRYWKNLYEYRIWADYKEVNLANFYNVKIKQFYQRFNETISRIIQELVNKDIIIDNRKD